MVIIRGEALKKQWEAALKDFKAGSLNVTDFTRERNLSKASFYKWASLLGISVKKEPLSFIELEPIPQAPSLELFPVEVKINNRCSIKIEAPWTQIIELVKALV
ncbi:hypothetical protein EBR43_11065 [bacterium]|nr:hypothetical protein [bacterium]NBX69714.1 hypothetical protein [Pseudomonadota bacterium]